MSSSAAQLDRTELIALAQRYITVLRDLDERNHRDLDALMALMHPDIDYSIPFLETPAEWRGATALVDFFKAMQGAFADVVYDIEQIYADPEAQTVVIEMTASRTVLPSGYHYANRYVMRLTIRDGRIAVLREYLNPIAAQEMSRRLNLA